MSMTPTLTPEMAKTSDELEDYADDLINLGDTPYTQFNDDDEL
jgi:hypothetical protein